MIQFQRSWQMGITRVVIFSIAAVALFLGFQSSVLIFDRSPSPIYKGVPPLGNSLRNSVKSEEVREDVLNSDEDIDFGEDYEIFHNGFESDLGNGTVLKKSKEGYITIEKIKGTEFVSVSVNDTDSRSKSLVSSPISENGALPLPIVTTRSELQKPKTGVQMLHKYLIHDMDRLLIENRASPQATIPKWPSPVDKQILEVRAQIENSPIVKSDQELYAPAFRNISTFRRSYQLMEQILKVYVYKEGDMPIFHKPFLTGIYASEGWFMKQMKESRRFLVDDPREAHLFYLPFCSRTLQAVKYIKDSHSHANLIEHLRNYVSIISSRYPYWNRTSGEDHFLAGCHDWATHETGVAMRSSIRALCNADVREGFEIGKDVSLPETFVRNGKDPLLDKGGKPSRKRSTLAFFAGSMHGYLRPILLQHWENKDPSMKIFGTIPKYGLTNEDTRKRKSKKKKKMKKVSMYIEYMKDSKYCICPRGYEVNSPRIVEAIFYECVPVIIADNFVPPFFEVLKWEAFSLILPESEVPMLKDILNAVPRRKYEALQRGVRSVQKHFLWNNTPLKYDLFHMILHSVWFNRVFQFRDG